MTNEELIAEIERLDAAATPGLWTYKEEGADEFWFGNGYYLIEPFGIPVGASKPESKADAELIASYRTLAVEAAKRLREAERLLKADEISRAILGGQG